MGSESGPFMFNNSSDFVMTEQVLFDGGWYWQDDILVCANPETGTDDSDS